MMIFSSKFSPKNPKCLFRMKHGISANSNMLNSMVVFTFSVLDWNYCFWADLFQKIKSKNNLLGKTGLTLSNLL